MKTQLTLLAIFALMNAALVFADSKIDSFKNRKDSAPFNVAWTVATADFDACKSDTTCCFNAGTITPTISANGD